MKKTLQNVIQYERFKTPMFMFEMGDFVDGNCVNLRDTDIINRACLFWDMACSQYSIELQSQDDATGVFVNRILEPNRKQGVTYPVNNAGFAAQQQEILNLWQRVLTFIK